jgi:hypothetical protein
MSSMLAGLRARLLEQRLGHRGAALVGVLGVLAP